MQKLQKPPANVKKIGNLIIIYSFTFSMAKTEYFRYMRLLVVLAGLFFYSENFAQQTLPVDNQILINGRVWHYIHQGIKGNPFLFTNQFLQGKVSIGGEDFAAQRLRYDIFSDEIMIPLDTILLQLNKERIDSFSIFWQNKDIDFLRIPEDSGYPFSGYLENVYSGESKLYIKYQKKIDRPGMAGFPDNFYQTRQIYFINDGISYVIRNKRDLLQILEKEKSQIKAFLKEKRVRVTKNDPVSFIPVLRFHDQLNAK
jgi:hypothetical protein